MFEADWIKVLLQLVTMLCAGFAALYTWWVSRSQATKSAIEEVDHRVARVETRVSSIEKDLDHQPTNDDVNRLGNRMTMLHGDLREIKGSLNALGHSVRLMNEHLINKGKD